MWYYHIPLVREGSPVSGSKLVGGAYIRRILIVIESSVQARCFQRKTEIPIRPERLIRCNVIRELRSSGARHCRSAFKRYSRPDIFGLDRPRIATAANTHACRI
jgi:hypothetical protein